LYSRSFYKALAYQIPLNRASDFSVQTPQFNIDRPLENELINTVELLIQTDKEETIAYIKRQKSLPYSDKAKKILLKKLKDLEYNLDFNNEEAKQDSSVSEKL